MNTRSFAAVAASLLIGTTASAQYLGPTPYLSAADTLLLIPSSGTLYVEDFEDDALTPGLTAMNGVRIGPGPFTDSVDADDGAIDGSGTAGGSYFSNGATSSFEFRFDAGVLGTFPTHAGVVWTDARAEALDEEYRTTFREWGVWQVRTGLRAPDEIFEVFDIGRALD